jgi:hypothetical protein
MKLRNIILALCTTLLVSGIVLYSCTRKKVDYLGPEYLSAPDGFSAGALTVTNPVDFTAGKCTLNVTFNNKVTYTVTYTGLTSGAVKSYIGLGDHIDATQVGGLWDGTHDGINFFRKSEAVSVVVSFLRSSYTVSGATVISEVKDYFTNPNLLPVVADNNGYENGVLDPFPAQFSFLSIPGCLTGSSGVVTAPKPPEGIYAFKMSGVSCQSDGFFVGGIQHRKAGFFFPTWTDPNKIYFNLYVYGSGNKNGRLSLEFHEADLSNNGTKPKGECQPPNTPGSPTVGIDEHDRCTDDAWVIQVPFDHVGWKLISVKYADMLPNASLDNGGSGNKIKEPTRVHRIQIGVLSLPTPGKNITAYFDFPVLSYGAPFDPSK